MAGSTFPRLKVWEEDEDVLTVDLNGEFNNILNNLKPTGMDDYSVNIPQMQIQTNPGEVGTESLSTSLAGEIERLRYVVSRIVGKSLWYQSPALSLEDTRNTIQSAIGLPANRVVSGKRTTANQPGFLVPAGTSKTITLQASTLEPFICFIDEVQYSFTTNIVFNNLSVASTSNNTCVVNDARLTSQEWSKLKGEDLDSLAVDTMGSEITTVNGQFAAFRNPQAGGELFMAQVFNSQSLRKAFRGFFFNSSNNGIPRDYLADNDILQLMRLTWVFLNRSGGLEVTYRPPFYSGTEPSSPSIGDFWLDFSTDRWKRYTSTGFVNAEAVFVGYCVQDTVNCIGARSEDFFSVLADENSLFLSPRTTSSVRTKFSDNSTNVYGQRFTWKQNEINWNFPSDLDSGVPNTTSKVYYFYLTDEGKPKISDVYPYNRLKDLRGWYHPHKPWRAIGGIYRNNVGEFDSLQIMSFAAMKDGDAVGRIDGVVDMFDQTEPNQGYLALNSSLFTAVRRELFARLYARMGNASGEGDATDTFNVPFVDGGFVRFVDGGAGHDADRAARTAQYTNGATGAAAGSFQATDNASHVHGVSDPGHTHPHNARALGGGSQSVVDGGGSGSLPFATINAAGTGITIDAQGSSDARPPNVYVYGYLKY